MGRRSEERFNQCARLCHRTGPVGDFVSEIGQRISPSASYRVRSWEGHRTPEHVIMVFQSCLTARAEPDRGIGGPLKLEFLGVGGLPFMDELEPLEMTGPFKNFQVAFMAIPVNICPR